jgi:hypothetical protein
MTGRKDRARCPEPKCQWRSPLEEKADARQHLETHLKLSHHKIADPVKEWLENSEHRSVLAEWRSNGRKKRGL